MAKNDFEGIQTRTTDALNSAPAGASSSLESGVGTHHHSRSERITALLANDAPWKIGKGRDQTRRALIELLGEMADAEFAYVETSRVLLQALPKAGWVNVTPYAIVGSPARSCTAAAPPSQFELSFQFITLDAGLEACSFDALKSLIRGALSYAFARLDGFDDWKATQIAECAKLNSPGRVE